MNNSSTAKSSGCSFSNVMVNQTPVYDNASRRVYDRKMKVHRARKKPVKWIK